MANKKVSQLTSKPSVLVTDLFPIADPSTGQLYKTTISDLGTAIGSGVSSVNGLVGAVVLDTDDIQELVSPTNKWFTDTRARAALSASSPLAYNSGTGVFSIPAATSSQNGYLTSTDWTTFNSKQAALSGTGFVKISGTTISYDNSTYLTTSVAASTYLPLTGGTLTGTLNGTNIIISNSLIAKGGTFNGGALSAGVLTIDGLGSDLLMNRANTSNGSSITLLTDAVEKWNIGLRSSGATDNFFIYNSNLSANSLTISSATSAATFTSSVTASAIYLTNMTSGSGALYYNSGANRVTVANYNASGTVVFEVNGGSTALTLNSNLSATFASTLSATGATLTGALSGTSGSFSSTLTTTGGTRSIQLVSYAADYNYLRSNGAPLVFGTQDSQDLYIQTNNTTRLTLVGSSGAATFSSSVTAQAIYATDATGSAILTTNGGGEGILSVNTANHLRILINGGEKVRFTSSGNVGIGTTAPSFSNTGTGLNVQSASGDGAYLKVNYSGGNSAEFRTGFSVAGIGNVSDNPFQFFTNNTERMRITSGGNVLIGTTSATPVSSNVIGINLSSGAQIQSSVDGRAVLLNRINDNGVTMEFHRGGTSVGNISVTTVSTTYNVTSDYRLKEDLKPINGLEIVNKIKVYDYKWKSEDSRMDGVLAHELAEVLPYAVTGVKDGEQMQSVDYSKIVPVMVQAIKDLKAELDTLKNK
jgi:hypothetical protein